MARKRKSEDEVDILENQVRELKTIIRSLQKRLKKVDRNYRHDAEVQSEPEIEEKLIHKTEKCSSCEEGTMATIVLSNKKTFKKCGHCGQRAKAEKTEEAV